MASGMGGAILAADFDNDGDVDVFAPTAYSTPDQLYRNNSDGTFDEIAALAGVASTDPNKNGVWFDYDGDHDLDLFLLGGDCYSQCLLAQKRARLYQQVSPGQFVDVIDTSGISMAGLDLASTHIGGVCAGDINNDGYLDLFVGLWAYKAHLFLNNQDGTFTDISDSSGVGVPGDFWQPMMHDFNGDGFLDIYAAVDFTENFLWINQQDSTFIDVAGPAGADQLMNDMGQTLGDYDNDGDLDIYTTNVYDYLGLNEHNVLLRNDSIDDVISFTDVAFEVGVGHGEWGWGTTFLDCNNDGWLDIAATNGFSHSGWLTDQSRFFLSNAEVPVTFTNVATDVGFDDTFWGSALVAFDADRDGDLDLMQSCNFNSPLRLLDCQPNKGAPVNHYLVVQPRMTGPNHFAIGAIVRISAGGLNQMRLISAGTSFFGQEPAEAFFGLGSADIATTVIVEYPNGSQATLTNVPADQVIEVYFADLNFDGAINGLDLGTLLANWSIPAGSPGCGGAPAGCPADLNADGVVDGIDLGILLANWTI